MEEKYLLDITRPYSYVSLGGLDEITEFACAALSQGFELVSCVRTGPSMVTRGYGAVFKNTRHEKFRNLMNSKQ